jgi:hypothetical protein
MQIRTGNFVRAALAAAILGLFLTTQAGCLLIAAGAATGGTVAYLKGDSEILMDGTPSQVASAAEKSAKDLGLHVVSNQSSELDSKVITRTADDVRVVVYAKAQGEKVSRVYVRMGVFGDDAMQQRMIEKIKANLPAAIATNPTTQPSTEKQSATADAK